MKILISFSIALFLSTCIWSQNKIQKLNKLITLGNTEFTNKNYIKAKTHYENTLKIDSVNKDVIYNLALTELYLNNKNNACRLFQKGYKLKDIGTREMILKFCGEIEYNESMYAWHLNDIPKFTYKNKGYILIENKKLNKKLISLFKKQVKKSNVLKKHKGKKIMINLKMINQDGKLICTTPSKYMNDVKPEIEKIFNTIVNYKPLTYKGKKVNAWGINYILPILL